MNMALVIIIIALVNNLLMLDINVATLTATTGIAIAKHITVVSNLAPITNDFKMSAISASLTCGKQVNNNPNLNSPKIKRSKRYSFTLIAKFAGICNLFLVNLVFISAISKFFYFSPLYILYWLYQYSLWIYPF